MMQVYGWNTGEGLIFECCSTWGCCGVLHLEQIITGLIASILEVIDNINPAGVVVYNLRFTLTAKFDKNLRLVFGFVFPLTL
jgi:hypothetical protein